MATSAFADAASLQYRVTVNINSALGSIGYIDFQFNPSSFPTQPASADVANFVTYGVLDPADPGDGHVEPD